MNCSLSDNGTFKEPGEFDLGRLVIQVKFLDFPQHLKNQYLISRELRMMPDFGVIGLLISK